MDAALATNLRAFLESQRDLDLAVHATPTSSPLAPERWVALATETGRLVGREVDLVDLSDLHGTLLAETLTQSLRRCLERVARRCHLESSWHLVDNTPKLLGICRTRNGPNGRGERGAESAATWNMQALRGAPHQRPRAV